MCLPLCDVNTFLYISLILMFGCLRCKLVDFLVMSIVQLTLMFGPIHCKFNSWPFQVTHIFCHLCTRFCNMQNIFNAFSELFFHIAKPVFNLACLHFVFKHQSNVSFFFFFNLFIYLLLFNRTFIDNSITAFIFWRIYPV